jgi:superfamily I DNA and/or RNA helicase
MEAQVAAHLVKFFETKTQVMHHQIGVISFYRAQVVAIQRRLVSADMQKPIVDVSTVDASQGDERDVIIISTARGEKSSFIEAEERVNVAISRAKTHLIIVTNVSALISSELWGIIFTAAKKVIRVRAPPPNDWQPFLDMTQP